MKDAVQKDVVSFASYPFESRPVRAVVPHINALPLIHLINEFERAKKFEPVGGYEGLIPEWFKYGPLEKYFLGEFDRGSYWSSLGGAYVLGCQCGEVGCWPLQCCISVHGDDVVWKEFCQPHRKTRDYSSFGPFVFDGAQYREVLITLIANISEGPAPS
jgi:hypothetical protein